MNEQALDAALRYIDSWLAHQQTHSATPGLQAAGLERYEGRFESLWAVSDFVPLGASLAVVNPGSTSPFSDAELLKPQSDGSFKVRRAASSFSFEGESVYYEFDENYEVEKVRYAGMSLLPSTNYRQSKITKNTNEKSPTKANNKSR